MGLEEEVDQFFLIMMGMVVFFMQCGFAFLEAGSVRSKNVTNILIKNVFDSFVSGIAYWLFGYAFAFGGTDNSFIGTKYFAASNLADTDFASFFFQYTFAATAATIVSGAVAERCEFMAYFAYSFFITGFIYPVVTHWQWGGGFLAEGKDYGGDIGVVGYQDFAGSGLVHCCGGVAAFVGALLLGPRIGRFDPVTKTPIQIRGHSVPIAALGGFILFFGFLAFNGGSQTAISNDGDGATVSIAVVNTIISASFGAFSSLLINRVHVFGNASWSLIVTINGALTGMVAACAGCNVLYPWGAAILGSLSGMTYHLWSWIVRRLKVDDPLDAVAVHFGGGSWGVIALAFLSRTDGILFHWNSRSGLVLAWQLAGLAVITAWTGVLSLLLFGTLRLLKVLRVPEEIEIKGLDIPKHNEPAYPLESYGHGHIEQIMQVLDQEGGGMVKVTQAFENVRGNAQKSNQIGVVNNGYDSNSKHERGPYENPEVHSQIKAAQSNIDGNQKAQPGNKPGNKNKPGTTKM